MKLLHTGDLHLGKAMHEASLLDDQRAMLDALAAELGREEYDALVIAGDVYDRTVPPAEAVSLFGDFLASIGERFPRLRTLIVPGNHDSAQRLSFASRILERNRIHVACDPERSFTPIIAENSGERVAFFLLPFLSPGSLERPEPEPEPAAGPARKGRALPELDLFSDAETQAVSTEGTRAERKILASQLDLAKEAARRLGLARPRDIPSVLVAHLFATSGKESASERVFVGAAERVPIGIFDGFSYVALGHLHRCQRVGDRAHYPGAPLAYSFDEAGEEKSFLRVEIDASAPGFPATVTPIPINPIRKVTRLEGAFADFHSSSRFDAHKDDYLEITLTDPGLVANPVHLLRPKFPLLLSLRQGIGVDAAPRASGDGVALPAEPAPPARDPAADFDEFSRELYGEVDPERAGLFSEILREAIDEA